MNNSRVVEPYLFFNGRCEEALKFYQRALGAKINAMMRFSDSPETPPPDKVPPGSGNNIMHASFQIGETTIMASDGCSQGEAKFEGFALSLAVPSELEADRAFAALSEGGHADMPLGETFFAKKFGMVTDRFGVSWMVIVNSRTPDEITAKGKAHATVA
jgi:PhnB protein